MNWTTRLGIVVTLMLLISPARAEEEAPKDDPRTVWIAHRVERLTGSPDERDAAIDELIDGDRDGDCTDAMIAVLPDHKRNVPVLEALIRALGRNHLRAAALPITKFLGHKEESIRANAAVSLEYIGSHDKKVIAELKKAAGREKDEGIANHIYRALGRCGIEESSVCALLLKKASRAKSEFATYGPSIGLAYYVGDKQAMRGVEKLIKQIGVPGGRRGGGQNTVKRGLVSWTLASIGNEKSAEFVREELIAKLDNVKAFWVQPLVRFWENVADACGDDSKLPAIAGGVRGFVAFAREGDLARYGAESRSLMDDARMGRESAGYTPKGDYLLDAGEDR